MLEVEREVRRYYTTIERLAEEANDTPGEVLARRLKEHPSVFSAAASFGVTKSTIYRWMKRYGVRFVDKAE